MSLWTWILLAAAAAFGLKLAGYLLPQRWLDRPSATELAGALTVGLLSSLTVVNAVATGQAWRFDARLLALGAAAIALKLRAPYIVVVAVGAVVAALARLAGLP